MADNKKKKAVAEAATKKTNQAPVWGSGIEETGAKWDDWSGDLNTPPGGVPLAFWRTSITNGGQDLDGLIAKLQSDIRGKSVSDAHYEQLWKAELDSRIARAKQEWEGLGEAGRQKYKAAEAEGNPHDPNTPEGQNWSRDQDEREVRDTNQAEYDKVEANLPEVERLAGEVALGNQDAVDKLNALLGSIKDPELQEYLGDYVSQAATAAPEQRDVEAQQRALAEFEAGYDARISPEEKLMMEMSRRQTESDLRAQRGALKNDLQARGVYGSGAELTQNMLSQQEAASRQALEMLGAQANASKRAQEMLRGGAELGTAMRDSSAKEAQFRGTAADQAAEWNKGFKQRWAEYKAKLERENNQDVVGRGVTAFKAGVDTRGEALSNQESLLGTRLGIAGGRTGTRTVNTAPVSQTSRDQSVTYVDDETRDTIEEDYG